jgi:Ca-activated chloride channel family protein
MHTVNHCSLQQLREKQSLCTKTLKFIHKLLVVISIYLVFGLLFQYVYADGTKDGTEDGVNDDGITDPYQAEHGSVWLLPANGIYLEAMQLHTDVDYDVTGAIARARVKQQFSNDSAFWAEGIYVFPLPENAAVDHFKMIIGERIIEGQVKERAEAKKTYEQAKAAGKKASLIEQQRPNVFTTSLANIAPGEMITVEFEYQQVLEYRDGRYRLRYPMVVGPRYHPGGNHPMPENPATAENQAEQADDVTSVSTQTDLLKNTHNPTRIHIQLDAGVNLAELGSTYHEIQINQTGETRYSIATIGESIVSDRDFELVWQPELSAQPQLSLFTEQGNERGKEQPAGDHYTMLTLLPPDLSYLQEKIQARDMIFVLDISGSMSGTSIEQAKASLLTAIDGLSDIDRFNIIWFNDRTGSLFPEVVTASTQYKDYANQFILRLQADGGTEMLPALKLALSKQEKFSPLRQVVFLTDGNISNEAELIELIDKQLGDSRLFTIGIGSAPNAYFMRKAANKGRGTFTYIGDLNEVQEKTATLLKKLETPALVNLQLVIDGNPVLQNTIEVFPSIIPDLYAGEPLTLFIRSREMPKNITLTGDYGNSEWQSSASMKESAKNGISIAWAREKIASLMDRQHASATDAERQQLRQEVVETALQHHLVSRFTSLVAVDVTPLNDSGMLYREQMKNNLPHGWQNSAPANHLSPAPGMILASLQLPQTATSSHLNLLLAALCFVSGLLLYHWRNRRWRNAIQTYGDVHS